MRVLLICLDMDPFGVQGDEHTGAAHLYVKETLEMLSENGVQTLAVTRWDSLSKLRVQVISENVRLVRIPVGPVDIRPKQFLWGREEETLERIRELLTEFHFEPDVLHTIYWYSGKVGLCLVNERGMRHIHTVTSLGKVKHAWTESLNAHDSDRERIEQILFEKAEVLVCVSEQEKGNLLRLYKNIEVDKIVPIGRGIDPNLFAPISIPEILDKDKHNGAVLSPDFQKCILFVGRLIESKQLHWLLQLYEQLLRDNTIVVPPLWIVGGTREDVLEGRRKYISSPELRRAETEGRIWWWGALPRNMLPFMYRRAIVTCVPSTYEAGARVILESMACGTPVIMTPTGYANELVLSGLNGVVAPLYDDPLWLLSLKGFIRDPVWHAVVALRAYKSVLPYFSLESFKERHWQVYKHVLGGDPLSIHNVSIQAAMDLFPNWEVPDKVVRSESEQPPRPEGTTWFENMQDAEQFGRLYPVPSGDSSSLAYVVHESNSTMRAKQFIPKRMFYTVFWPMNSECTYRPAAARFNAEVTFSVDPFFLPILHADRERGLIIRRETEVVLETWWNPPRIIQLFGLVRGFQTRQTSQWLTEGALSCPQVGKYPTWSELQEISNCYQSFNMQFRSGARWHSPTSLSVELQVLRKGISEKVLHFPEGLLPSLCQGIDILTDALPEEVAQAIVWGECRHGHVVWDDVGQLRGIDAETACVGEIEADFGNFIWWYFDLRTTPLSTVKWQIAEEVFDLWRADLGLKQLAFGWTWMRTVYFLLWDLSRGCYERYSRFVQYLQEFPILWNRLGF